MAAEITRDELKRKLDSREEFVLVETLPAERYQQGHIPGAINLPPDQIRQLAPKLLPDKNAEIVVYCGAFTWHASENAARELAEMGYTNITDYSGGKQDWSEGGLPLVGKDEQAAWTRRKGDGMKLTSSAFVHGSAIPSQFTCEGQDISPEISWADAPKETKSFVLVLHDPDAPRANGFYHWVMYNIPPRVERIPENAPKHATLPGLGLQGKNDAGKTGYMGPCPPSGTHRYFFRLYSLRESLDLKPGADYKDVLSAIEGKIIEQTELMGTYAKGQERAA
jgi:Raf kinase inhibitor-like YbhB/YbcL family protein